MTKTFSFSEFCNQKLFKTFPELLDHPHYQAIIQNALEYGNLPGALDCGDTSAHGIYEDAFCYYVLELIKSNDKESKKKVKKAFALIEELTHEEDFEVRCVAKVSFIEPFLSKIEPMKEVEKYLGPKSLEMAREIASFRFGMNPRTWKKETRKTSY